MKKTNEYSVFYENACTPVSMDGIVTSCYLIMLTIWIFIVILSLVFCLPIQCCLHLILCVRRCDAMQCDEHYSSFSCMHTQTYVFIHTTLVTNQPKGNWCATRAPHEREIFWMQMRAMQWSNRIWNSFKFRYMQLMQPGLYDSVGL